MLLIISLTWRQSDQTSSYWGLCSTEHWFVERSSTRLPGDGFFNCVIVVLLTGCRQCRERFLPVPESCIPKCSGNGMDPSVLTVSSTWWMPWPLFLSQREQLKPLSKVKTQDHQTLFNQTKGLLRSTGKSEKIHINPDLIEHFKCSTCLTHHWQEQAGAHTSCLWRKSKDLT